MTSAFLAQLLGYLENPPLCSNVLAESPMFCRLNTLVISLNPSMVLDYSRDAKPNYHSKEEEEDEIFLFPLSSFGGYRGER